MYILVSETRGVEYASTSKKKCQQEMKRLIKDDKENGGYIDNYYIEEDDSGFYEEGLQWPIKYIRRQPDITYMVRTLTGYYTRLRRL